jgi:hypothetical protein
VTSRDQGLQNCTGGTWNIIKWNGMNSRFALIHKKVQEQKMTEKLNNFEKFERKKNQISALFLTQRPPDDWPDALDHLAIGLVANTQNLEKQVKSCYLVRGCPI